MRVDANISIRPRGTDQLNTKVEVKNMNSVRHVGDAIAYEINRQTAASIRGANRSAYPPLGPGKKCHSAMRGKFEGPCVPDPIGTSDSNHRGMEERNAVKASGNAGPSRQIASAGNTD